MSQIPAVCRGFRPQQNHHSVGQGWRESSQRVALRDWPNAGVERRTTTRSEGGKSVTKGFRRTSTSWIGPGFQYINLLTAYRPSHVPATHHPNQGRSSCLRRPPHSCKSSTTSPTLHPALATDSTLYSASRSICNVKKNWNPMVWCSLLTV